MMDLEQGDILWVGKGRAMKDFEKFFEDMPSDFLSAVIGWTKWFQTAKESEIPALVRSLNESATVTVMMTSSLP